MTILTQARNSSIFRALAVAVLLVPAVAGIIWDEVLLAAPIIGLVAWIGFWPAYFIFCLLWTALGFILFTVWLYLGSWLKEHLGRKQNPEQVIQEVAPKENQTWRKKLVLRAAKVARIFGALVASVTLGPIGAWPVLRLIGYQVRDVYLLTFIAAWIFGGIWVPFYGLGVWGLGLDRLF